MKPLVTGGRRVGDEQQKLWDWVDDPVIEDSPTARTAVGSFVEEWLAKCLGALVLPIHSGRLCPDLLLGASTYIECKSVGRRGNLTLYDSKMSLYDEVPEQVLYAVVRHSWQWVRPLRLSEMKEQVASSIQEVLVAPASYVHRLARKKRRISSPREGRPELEHSRRLGPADWRQWAGRAVRRRVWDGSQYATVRDRAGLPLGYWTRRHRVAAAHLLLELRNQRLSVSLAPAPRPAHQGHMVRVVDGSNPGWYRELCQQFETVRNGRRRLQTKVKRKEVVRLLSNIAQGVALRGGALSGAVVAYLEERS